VPAQQFGERLLRAVQRLEHQLGVRLRLSHVS
jgi:hypothetical protein